MNESTCSSKFQADLRKTLPGCEVIKHADKSMIGMVDASATFNKLTLWMEYKFIGPKTEGVCAAFMRDGCWSPTSVASSSPTQFDMVKRLAAAGHCVYLFWVLDHAALRKRVGSVVLWHPISNYIYRAESTKEMVSSVGRLLTVDGLIKTMETLPPAYHQT